MNTREKHKILKDWIVKKYNQSNNWENGIWLYYQGDDNFLQLIKPLFDKWQELLKKGYSEDKLIDYFLEVIRYYLPELKGTNLYFSLDIYDEKIYKTI